MIGEYDGLIIIERMREEKKNSASREKLNTEMIFQSFWKVVFDENLEFLKKRREQLFSTGVNEVIFDISHIGSFDQFSDWWLKLWNLKHCLACSGRSRGLSHRISTFVVVIGYVTRACFCCYCLVFCDF